MQIKLIVVGNVKETFYQNKIDEFQKQINKHEIGALLGYSQEWYNFSSLSASRKKIPFDGIYVIDAGTEDITNSGTKSSWLSALMGRRWIIPKSKKVLQQQNREANQVLHL